MSISLTLVSLLLYTLRKEPKADKPSLAANEGSSKPEDLEREMVSLFHISR